MLSLIDTLESDGVYEMSPDMRDKHRNLRQKLHNMDVIAPSRTAFQLSENFRPLGISDIKETSQSVTNNFCTQDPRDGHDQQATDDPNDLNVGANDVRAVVQLFASAMVDADAAVNQEELNSAAAKYDHPGSEMLR